MRELPPGHLGVRGEAKELNMSGGQVAKNRTLKVWYLQRSLYCKSMQEKAVKFYSLYENLPKRFSLRGLVTSLSQYKVNPG